MKRALLLFLFLLSGTFAFSRQAHRAISSTDLEADQELLGLLIKLGETERARAFSTIILRKHPQDRATLVMLGNLYLAKEEKEALKRVVATLTRLYPKDREVLYLAAASLQLSKQHTEARSAFQLLRDDWHDGPFPYEQELAASSKESRDWPAALESYKRLLASGTLKAKQRFEIRQALDEIYRAHLPRLEMEYQSVWLNEGTVQRSKANYSHDLARDLRAFLEMRGDYIYLRSEPGAPSRSRWRSEGLAGLLWDFDQNWAGGGWLGASRSYPLIGATIRRKLEHERIAQMQISLYEKAVDSLLLESLDGRQSDISFKVEGGINKDLYGGADIAFREVVVDYESIGTGLMAEWYLEQVLWRAEPKITCAYQGSLSLFNPNAEYDRLARKYGAGPANDPTSKQELITDYVQRHGISFAVEEDFSFGIVLRAVAGIEYAVELGSFEYNWMAGGSWFPKKSLELYANAAFYSSAADSNQSSSSIQLTCGLKYYF